MINPETTDRLLGRNGNPGVLAFDEYDVYPCSSGGWKLCQKVTKSKHCRSGLLTWAFFHEYDEAIGVLDAVRDKQSRIRSRIETIAHG